MGFWFHFHGVGTEYSKNIFEQTTDTMCQDSCIFEIPVCDSYTLYLFIDALDYALGCEYF